MRTRDAVAASAEYLIDCSAFLLLLLLLLLLLVHHPQPCQTKVASTAPENLWQIGVPSSQFLPFPGGFQWRFFFDSRLTFAINVLARMKNLVACVGGCNKLSPDSAER